MEAAGLILVGPTRPYNSHNHHTYHGCKLGVCFSDIEGIVGLYPLLLMVYPM